MGQKVNSNIFRISYEKHYKTSRYLAKDKEEHSTYTFKSVEINNYLNNIFKFFGLLVHSSIVYFTTKQLTISVAYYITKKGSKFLKNSRVFFKPKLKKSSSNFTEILLESLSTFTNFNVKIFITLLNLNKELFIKLPKFFTKTLKKKKFELREFSKTYFFNQTINIILLIIRLKNSAKLLTDFLIFQLQRLKKHNYFLYFFKETTILFLKSNLSRIRGIKLVINGRLKKVPRTSSKKIVVGNIPLNLVKADIDYYQNTLFTRNGSVGINVWIF